MFVHSQEGELCLGTPHKIILYVISLQHSVTFPQSTFAARHYFGMYIVGNSKAITCRNPSATTIEWLHNGSVVQSGAGPQQTLWLSVNDSIHHNLYTCRGYRNLTIFESDNFTMIVNGMCNHQHKCSIYTFVHVTILRAQLSIIFKP